MPVTTFITPEERAAFIVTDKDVLEWMDTAERVTGKRPIVEERISVIPRWFRKPRRYVRYALYYPTHGCECQITNFCGKTDWSINLWVDKANLVNYLIGYVAGFEAPRPATSAAREAQA
jgi:hypothetical protein